MTPSAASRMALEGEVSIYQAAQLRAQLLQWLAQAPASSSAQPWVLDLSAVTEFDSAGLQLLLAAQHTAQQQQITVHFESASAAVQEVCALLQLDAQLQPLEKAASA